MYDKGFLICHHKLILRSISSCILLEIKFPKPSGDISCGYISDNNKLVYYLVCNNSHGLSLPVITELITFLGVGKK